MKCRKKKWFYKTKITWKEHEGKSLWSLISRLWRWMCHAMLERMYTTHCVWILCTDSPVLRNYCPGVSPLGSQEWPNIKNKREQHRASAVSADLSWEQGFKVQTHYSFYALPAGVCDPVYRTSWDGDPRALRMRGTVVCLCARSSALLSCQSELPVIFPLPL